MEGLIEILGFGDVLGIVWNMAAYLGMGVITAGVLSSRMRKHFFFWGPLVLLLYALFYLNNAILTGLQLVVTVSGLLNLLDVKKRSPYLVGVLTAIVYLILIFMGELSNVWFWLGSFGLLGIALGLTQLPKRIGFAIMLVGGILIVVYAYALAIWVFFVLNIIFAVANAIELARTDAGAAEKLIAE